MRPIVWILGGFGLAGLALLTASSDEATSEPVPAPTFDTPPRNWDERDARLAFLRRVKPDALITSWDGYSRHTYWVVDQPLDRKAPWTYTESVGGTGPMAARQIDEYGRHVTGVSGDPLGTLLQAAGYALPFIPGVGPAASAALAAGIAWAQGKSAQEALLAAARASVPGGAMGQLAFDVGVAVASGRPVDDAAKEALLAQVPGGKEAYEQGQEAWQLYEDAKG